jgi:hypothetical protein
MTGAYIRSLKWADWLVNAVTDPRALARQISSHATGFVSSSFLFPVISAAVFIVSWSLLSVQSTFFFTKITYGWILLSLVNAGWALLISLLIGLGLQFRNVQGNLRALLTLANFSQLPGVFLLPAAAIFAVLGFAPVLFLVLFLIVSSLWGAYILVMGVCELYSLTVSRCASLYLIACGALLIAALIFVISGGALIAGRIMTL